MKEGKQWCFGMKAHVGVDADTKLIRSVATAANVTASRMLGELLRGQETDVWGDQAYQCQTEQNPTSTYKHRQIHHYFRPSLKVLRVKIAWVEAKLFKKFEDFCLVRYR
ncbi:MAG: transposase [Acidobacteriales bacterium]|nr:transposase [Terriglobales bacterium]